MYQAAEDPRVEAALAGVASVLGEAGIVVGLVRRLGDHVDLHLDWTPGTCPERVQRALDAARLALRRSLPQVDCRLVGPDGRRFRAR